MDVADKLIDSGEVRRGYLGVIIQDLSPEMAASFGYDGRGVLIEHPMGGGPGDAAGLQPGDIVTHVAGRPVRRDRCAAARPSPCTSPAARSTLTVFRRGETLTLTATLAELGGPTLLADPPPGAGGSGLPGPLASLQPTRPFDTEGTLSQLGVQRLAGFTPRDAVRLGYPVAEGVMVLEVRPRSTAAAARVAPGCIITAVGDTPVATPRDLDRALRGKAPTDPIRLTLRVWDSQAGEYLTRYTLLQAVGW